jgi:membrane-associated protein
MIMAHLQIILQLRYLILIPLMILEGPLVTFVAGFLASAHVFEAEDIIIVSVVSNLIGDLLHYAIGRWGRISFIKRWGRYIGMSPERVISIENHFNKHGGKSLLLAKAAPAFGSITLVAAGLARYSLWRFIILNLLAEIPKSALFFGLGFYFGSAYGGVKHYLALSSLVLAGIVLFILVRYGISRQANKQNGEE